MTKCQGNWKISSLQRKFGETKNRVVLAEYSKLLAEKLGLVTTGYTRINGFYPFEHLDCVHRLVTGYWLVSKLLQRPEGKDAYTPKAPIIGSYVVLVNQSI